MFDSLPSLLELLDLETLEDNLFRAHSRDLGSGRVFGGQVVAQALVAGSRTVEGLLPHSLHAYFLRQGDIRRPIVYDVDRVRDGRSYATRRVLAIQHGQPILAVMISFHRQEPGVEHQMPAPDLLEPEHRLNRPLLALIPQPDGAGGAGRAVPPLPMDLRLVGREEAGGDPLRTALWFRSSEALSDDPLVHRCVLAYASDFYMLSVAARPHGCDPLGPGAFIATVDHAIWFHRDLRADDWLLHAIDTPSAQAARGFARGLIYDRRGRLVASTAQEGVLRLPLG